MMNLTTIQANFLLEAYGKEYNRSNYRNLLSMLLEKKRKHTSKTYKVSSDTMTVVSEGNEINIYENGVLTRSFQKFTYKHMKKELEAAIIYFKSHEEYLEIKTMIENLEGYTAHEKEIIVQIFNSEDVEDLEKLNRWLIETKEVFEELLEEDEDLTFKDVVRGLYHTSYEYFETE